MMYDFFPFVPLLEFYRTFLNQTFEHKLACFGWCLLFEHSSSFCERN